MGSKNCVFCAKKETIKHLFFECHYATFIWRAVQFSFGLSPHTSCCHIASSWLQGLDNKRKSLIWTGVAAICWAIWLSRNDIVFNKDISPTYLQVLFRGTYWVRFWAQLQKLEENKAILIQGARHIESVVMGVFAENGWRFSNRISM